MSPINPVVIPDLSEGRRGKWKSGARLRISGIYRFLCRAMRCGSRIRRMLSNKCICFIWRSKLFVSGIWKPRNFFLTLIP